MFATPGAVSTQSRIPVSLSRTQWALIGVFALAHALDVAISGYCFYGTTGYGELNPLFSWAVAMPHVFVPLITVTKIAAIGLVIAMTLVANRTIRDSGTLVAGTASIMSCGLVGAMIAGLV